MSTIILCTLSVNASECFSDKQNQPSTVQENVKTEQDKLQLMTFNIRYANPRDGKNRWKYREQMVANIVLDHQVDLGGMQEVTHPQLQDLQKSLADYRFVGVARDDGKTKGEYSPIFYHKKRFELMKHDTFWLSKTPDKIGSVGWDAALTRIATWAKLKNIKTGKIFILVNTHFDHRGKKAREESALLISKKLKTIAKDLPVIVMGDFNAVIKSKPYLTLATAKLDEHRSLRDSRKISRSKPTGPNSTFNGFHKAIPNRVIDHLFVSPKFEVQSHKVIDKKVDDRFPSDHFPVLIEARLK